MSDGVRAQTTWRRRLAIIGAIAVVHLNATWIIWRIGVGLTSMGVTKTLTGPLGYVWVLLVLPVVWALPPWDDWPVTIALHVANSILWAIALYALWSLAQAIRRRGRAT